MRIRDKRLENALRKLSHCRSVECKLSRDRHKNAAVQRGCGLLGRAVPGRGVRTVEDAGHYRNVKSAKMMASSTSWVRR